MGKDVWEGVTVVNKCDSPKEVCQLVGRCDGHGENRGIGRNFSRGGRFKC